MTIFKEIYDLLYNNDCVIVPEFGAFVLKSHSAYIKDDTFYPPRKVISFNVMLDENDGLLVKHLSNSRNISYKKALKTINDETQSLKNELSADKKIKIDPLGYIELSSEGNLVFYPEESINFESNSFGLSSFSRQPILKSVKNGLYAVDFGGGQVDITSGKFVFTCTEAYKIENGKVTNPVKGATLIGNGPDVLKRVKMVGNDSKMDTGIGTCGKDGESVPVGVGQPTMLIENLTVGGTATA